MTGVQLTLLIVFGLCILASGFLSGSETALVAVPRERVHQLADQGRRGQHLADLTADPERMLGTLLLANNFVNVLAASVATSLAIQLIGEPWGPWVATIVVTSLILVVGEITPKTLATRRPERYAVAVAIPIYWLGRVLEPISRVFIAISRRILSFGPSDDRGPLITEDDIRAMAALGEMEGEIHTGEREIIESLFRLADSPLRDIMTPRPDVVSLEAPVTEDKVRRLVAATGHSRYPVRAEGSGLDELEGVLYVKDLVRVQTGVTAQQIRSMLRDPEIAPESTPVLDMLHEMRSKRFGFAIVVDEHGGVEGIVTIKDLISELVGDIQDEYDPGIPTAFEAADGTWIADGRVPVDELEEALGVELPDGPYSTVGGLFLAVAGDIPDEGDHLDLDGTIELTVLRMDRHRIHRLRVERVVQTS